MSERFAEPDEICAICGHSCVEPGVCSSCSEEILHMAFVQDVGRELDYLHGTSYMNNEAYQNFLSDLLRETRRVEEGKELLAAADRTAKLGS